MFLFRLALPTMLFIAAVSAPLHAEPTASVEAFIDEARLIRLQADAAQIIVGNPAIADVTAQSARILVVTGKSYGATNLIVLDAAGKQLLDTRLGVKDRKLQLVRVYKGTVRQSLRCAPECQRMLAIGDDKSQFEQVADSVAKKFGVVQSAMGAGR